MYTVECLQQKSLRDLKAIASELGVNPDGHRGYKQSWILAIGKNLPVVETTPRAIGKNLPVVETSPGIVSAAFGDDRESIEERTHGITFSHSFLSRYSPPYSEKRFLSDEFGQLTLLDFEEDEEPPDPDDYSTEFEFWAAYDAYCDRHLHEVVEQCTETLAQPVSTGAMLTEPIETSLESMCEWAPCPQEWYEPVMLVDAEDAKRCPCGAIGYPDRCDGETVTIFLPHRIVTVPCFKYDLSRFQAVRSPPGGDAIQ